MTGSLPPNPCLAQAASLGRTSTPRPPGSQGDGEVGASLQSYVFSNTSLAGMRGRSYSATPCGYATQKWRTCPSAGQSREPERRDTPPSPERKRGVAVVRQQTLGSQPLAYARGSDWRPYRSTSMWPPTPCPLRVALSKDRCYSACDKSPRSCRHRTRGRHSRGD
jgi:hypothetical protein